MKAFQTLHPLWLLCGCGEPANGGNKDLGLVRECLAPVVHILELDDVELSLSIPVCAHETGPESRLALKVVLLEDMLPI